MKATTVIQKARQCVVTPRASQPGVYDVKSPSGARYVVDLTRGGVCTCEWSRRGGVACSHELAARRLHEALWNGRKCSFQKGKLQEVARKQHKAVKPVADGVVLVMRDRIPPTPPPQPPPPSREVRVAFLWSRMQPPDDTEEFLVFDLFVQERDGSWRKAKAKNLADLLEIAEEVGFTASAPRLVRGNERPGWHRYEMSLRR